MRIPPCCVLRWSFLTYLIASAYANEIPRTTDGETQQNEVIGIVAHKDGSRMFPIDTNSTEFNNMFSNSSTSYFTGLRRASKQSVYEIILNNKEEKPYINDIQDDTIQKVVMNRDSPVSNSPSVESILLSSAHVRTLQRSSNAVDKTMFQFLRGSNVVSMSTDSTFSNAAQRFPSRALLAMRASSLLIDETISSNELAASEEVDPILRLGDEYKAIRVLKRVFLIAGGVIMPLYLIREIFNSVIAMARVHHARVATSLNLGDESLSFKNLIYLSNSHGSHTAVDSHTDMNLRLWVRHGPRLLTTTPLFFWLEGLTYTMLIITSLSYFTQFNFIVNFPGRLSYLVFLFSLFSTLFMHFFNVLFSTFAAYYDAHTKLTSRRIKTRYHKVAMDGSVENGESKLSDNQPPTETLASRKKGSTSTAHSYSWLRSLSATSVACICVLPMIVAFLCSQYCIQSFYAFGILIASTVKHGWFLPLAWSNTRSRSNQMITRILYALLVYATLLMILQLTASFINYCRPMPRKKVLGMMRWEKRCYIRQRYSKLVLSLYHLLLLVILCLYVNEKPDNDTLVIYHSLLTYSFMSISVLVFVSSRIHQIYEDRRFRYMDGDLLSTLINDSPLDHDIEDSFMKSQMAPDANALFSSFKNIPLFEFLLVNEPLLCRELQRICLETDDKKAKTDQDHVHAFKEHKGNALSYLTPLSEDMLKIPCLHFRKFASDLKIKIDAEPDLKNTEKFERTMVIASQISKHLYGLCQYHIIHRFCPWELEHLSLDDMPKGGKEYEWFVKASDPVAIAVVDYFEKKAQDRLIKEGNSWENLLEDWPLAIRLERLLFEAKVLRYIWKSKSAPTETEILCDAKNYLFIIGCLRKQVRYWRGYCLRNNGEKQLKHWQPVFDDLEKAALQYYESVGNGLIDLAQKALKDQREGNNNIPVIDGDLGVRCNVFLETITNNLKQHIEKTWGAGIEMMNELATFTMAGLKNYLPTGINQYKSALTIVPYLKSS